MIMSELNYDKYNLWTPWIVVLSAAMLNLQVKMTIFRGISIEIVMLKFYYYLH